MKLLFLDVDGVLNHRHSIGWRTPNLELDWRVLDPNNIFHLNRILVETDAKVVLTSTWRFNSEGLQMLKECILEDSIIGRTPSKRKFSQSVDRKVEILAWLHEVWPFTFGWDDVTSVQSMAVLDDDTDADLGDGSFFKTSFEEEGLTKEIADRVIAHLNHTSSS